MPGEPRRVRRGPHGHAGDAVSPAGPGPGAAPARAEPDDVLWTAIGEPSRRRLLDVLLVAGDATPTALAAQLPFTRQAVAKHLAVLQSAGLVEHRRAGREVHYTVRTERLEQAAAAMTAVASSWDGRLAAIKQIAERLYAEERSR
jgi:DNA-binding transcriptional ArsR family regulator